MARTVLTYDAGAVDAGGASVAFTSGVTVTEAALSLSDNTTANVSTSKHGLTPKLPNDATKFLDGTGGYTVPSGSGIPATIFDAKGDLIAASAADTAARLAAGSNGKLLATASGETTGLKWDTGYLGGLELVYRYTVAGSDKGSIDTGADTADAGTNDWTNCDMIEWRLMGRTDEAVILSVIDMIWNNDTSSIYNSAFIDQSTSTVSGGGSGSSPAAKFQGIIAGASAASNIPGTMRGVVQAPTLTTFYKIMEFYCGTTNNTGTSRNQDVEVMTYGSTSALTRMKVSPNTSGKLFKVGTQLLIYKRRNA